MENSKLGKVVIDSTQEVTVEQLKEMFPEKKNTITEKTVNVINQATKDPSFDCHTFLGELVTFSSVMKNRSMSLRDYIRAVKFVAYLPINDYNYTATYKASFPEDEFVQKRKNMKAPEPGALELHNQASRYAKLKAVVDIQAMAQTPFDIMFTGERYKMLGVLSNEANNSMYSKDRINAADKFLVHTAKIINSMELNVTQELGEESMNVQKQLLAQFDKVAESQAKLLKAGNSLKDVQQLGIVTDAEVI